MDADTEVFSVIGNPVKHSLSPFMHNTAFELLSVNGVYTAFNLDDLESGIKGIRALGIKGVSVTIPHKESVINYLDKVSESALKIKAVNTITNNNGVLEGSNTDWTGFLISLREHTEIKNKKTLVIGAGGAARAVCYALNYENADLYITNRTSSKGIGLAKDFSGKFVYENDLKHLGPEIIINTTSVGMFPHIEKTPVDKNVFQNTGVAFDIVYNPVETRFLREAKSMGFKTVSGIGMFVYQGADQFKQWTGLTFPSQVMKEAVFKKLTLKEKT